MRTMVLAMSIALLTTFFAAAPSVADAPSRSGQVGRRADVMMTHLQSVLAPRSKLLQLL